jgi:hypothetical protein
MLATKDNKKKTRFIASAEAHTYLNANRFAVSKKRDGVWDGSPAANHPKHRLSNRRMQQEDLDAGYRV